MNITKWLLSKGIGSPGQTAKVFCERFNFYYDVCNENISETLHVIYNERVAANLRAGNKKALFSEMPPNLPVNEAQEDFPLYIFVMMYLETSNFRNGVTTQPKLFKETVEIIHEVVLKRCPKSIKYNIDEFSKKALWFIEFNHPYFAKIERINNFM